MNVANFNIDRLIGWKNIFKLLEDNPQELASLFDDHFRLADLDISARVLQHWYKSGLLPDKELKGRNHRFNFVELIYLYLVQDLRDIGFPLDRIKKFKSSMFYIVDPVDILNHESLDNDDSKQRDQALGSVRRILEEIPKEDRQIYHISILILFVIAFKIEIDIIVLANGSTYIEPTRKDKNESVFDLENEHRIVLPIFKYLQKFISKEKYFKMLSSFRLINEGEQYLLRQVRDGNYSSIKIKFGKGKMELFEMTKNTKIDNAARLDEILLKGGYQNIELITQDGVISYAAITNKKKI